MVCAYISCYYQVQYLKIVKLLALEKFIKKCPRVQEDILYFFFISGIAYEYVALFRDNP